MEYPFGPALVEVFISSLRINESWNYNTKEGLYKKE